MHSTLPSVQNVEKVTGRFPGYLYNVRISANKDELLDWFKPISKQSDQVQTRIKKALEDAGIPNAVEATTDGQSVYTWLAAAMGKGEKVSDPVLKQRASAALKKDGITCIKYLDHMSRGRRLKELKMKDIMILRY